jgi:hypothetical protein
MRIVLRGFWISLVTFPGILVAQLGPNGATASFKGSLPPPATVRLSLSQGLGVAVRLDGLEKEFEKVRDHVRAADAHIFLKAVRYARDFEEWYDKTPEESARKAHSLLAEAESRIEALKHGQTPWMEGSGQKVLGFYSQIDGSPQPYGVEIPEGLKWGGDQKEVPMWIWLHGRGDTATDLNFVYSRLTAKKTGQFQPKGTIVIHPFGRYCNGWKSAGETDVFECRDDAVSRFNADKNRIALAGFSMGGAGAWHIGAHFADQWACVHTGAGFVDVKRYQKLTKEQYPVWYEQKLWGVYDVPDYARNFLNVPLVCYSGENDAQRDSAEYMMEVLGKEGIKPPHLIGPGMGHKYHPETIKELQTQIEKAVAKGRDPWPKKVSIQTKCTRYGKMFWVKILALEKLWEDARVDAEIDDAKKQVSVTTKNVHWLSLDLKGAIGEARDQYQVVIDGVVQSTDDANSYARCKTPEHPEGAFQAGGNHPGAMRKYGGDDGLIDEVFHRPFVVVLPDGPCANPQVDQWVKSESERFIRRWRTLMRGDPRVKKASELTLDEMEGKAGVLCLWGDAIGNSFLAKNLDKLIMPIWTNKEFSFGVKRYNAETHVPVVSHCIPRDGSGGGMQRFVLNSGLTFREAHDRTNSLQNPKLPDWAILDITQPPSNESAGKVVEADFFDESWRVKTSTPAR